MLTVGVGVGVGLGLGEGLGVGFGVGLGLGEGLGVGVGGALVQAAVEFRVIERSALSCMLPSPLCWLNLPVIMSPETVPAKL
jgi:hypothetical protein